MSASNDDELAMLRHQRKLELQKQIEAQASKQVEAEFAEQKKQIENSAIDSAMKKLLSPDARSRLATISLATPERSNQIKTDLEQLGLKVFLHSNKKKIDLKSDIYLVNAYDQTKLFFNKCKNVFLGGSLINHGGQNPLEAARYGCNILHGPNIYNFKEIYDFLKKNKISQNINNKNEMTKSLLKLFSKKSETKKIQNKLNLISQKILVNTYKEVKLILKNEI